MPFGAGTGITTPQGAVAIETLKVGSEVLAASGSPSHLTWSPVAVVMIHSTPPLQPEVCWVAFDEGRNLICTHDQRFIAPGEKLLDQDGNDILIVEIIMGTYTGDLYHFATTQEPPIEGHRILAGGVVAEDFKLD